MARNILPTAIDRFQYALPQIVLMSRPGTAVLAQAPPDTEIRITIEKIDQVNVVDVSVSVPATPRQTWAVLTDWDNLNSFMTNVKASRIIARSGDTARVRQTVRAGFPVVEMRRYPSWSGEALHLASIAPSENRDRNDMKRISTSAVLITCLALAASIPALAAKDETDKTIAKVNGKAIPKSRADAMVAMQIAQGRPDSEQLRNAAKDELVNREVLEQEAQSQGFGKKPEVKNQMDLARQSVLINAFMQDYVLGHPISEAMLKKEYETLKVQAGDKEYKARHILVENEDAAKAIIARLKKGEKFEELARQSKDPGSKDRGGDLGWAPPSNYVQPFAEAMIALEQGKYTEIPVKTNFGYHVIMLEDSRALKVPPFDAAKSQLLKRMQAQLVVKHVAELRAKAKVE